MLLLLLLLLLFVAVAVAVTLLRGYCRGLTPTTVVTLLLPPVVVKGQSALYFASMRIDLRRFYD
jgi:hypothetical protein